MSAQDIDLVRRVCSVAGKLQLLQSPARFAAGAMKDGIARGLVSALSTAPGQLAFETLELYWARKYGGKPARASSSVLRSLWAASTVTLGDLQANASHYEYRDVLGFPLAMQPNYSGGWCQSPASDEKIFEAARGRSWLFEPGGFDSVKMTPDTPSEGVLDTRTRDLIADIRSIPGCRAHLLWGPPGAGKSVAAKQIAKEIGGSWARVCGSVCTSAEVWRALDILRPPALIIDDIDINADNESALMSGLERAREWARVIISTANTLPTGDEEDRSQLRGAVIRRASDGKLIHYCALSREVREALAPDVPEELRASTDDLLAKYQVELQRRATARGVTQADVDELRGLQELVGAR